MDAVQRMRCPWHTAAAAVTCHAVCGKRHRPRVAVRRPKATCLLPVLLRRHQGVLSNEIQLGE
jgi:hypothetical protein